MKVRNSLFAILFICFTLAFAKAQRGVKVGYIDMEYILEKVPEYQKAVTRLDERMDKWKQEIDALQTAIDKSTEELKNERVLLTKELIEEKEEEIQLKEEELAEYQAKRFGAQGDFILQKKQLIQPVQDQVINAVQKICKLKKYDFAMDASEVSLLYAAERHDISDLVLKEIGRSTKKGAAAKELQKEIDDEMKEPILSVQEAELKQEKEDARSAKIDQLNSKRLEAKRKRDSTREARKAAQLEKRRKMLEEKKRRRDSIAQARKRKDD